MAPFLDAGILNHADMDCHAYIYQTPEDDSTSPHHSDSVKALKALKAVHELLDKLFSTSSPYHNENKPLNNDTLDGLVNDAFLILSRAATLTPPSSPGRRPQEMDSGQQQQQQQQQDISMARTQEINNDLESDLIIHAAKAPTPHNTLDGSGSLSGVSPVSTKAPTTRPDVNTANGAEHTAQVPEPERPNYTQATLTSTLAHEGTKVPVPAGGGPEVVAAKVGAESANHATTAIHNHHPKPSAPSSTNRLGELAETITRSVDTISSSLNRPGGIADCEVADLKLVDAANELLGMVRPGQDTIMGWFAQMSVVSVVNVFQHWGVFDLIPSQPGAGISFWKLAEKVGVEEGLLIRMSWMLTSSSVLWYFPPSTAGSHKGSLAHTATSLLLRSKSPLSSMFKLLHTNIVETSASMPSYFDTYGRKEPVGPGHIPMSYLAGQPELAYFDLLNQDPQRVKEFTHAMSIQHRRSPITGMFDLTSVIALAEQLEQSRKLQAEERPVWVDIGGSDGAVIKTFREKYPGLKPEWCVVQDLPQVVEAAREAAKDDALLKGVRFCPLDFHNEAPVEGALVYYLRNIVRDYSDPVVINILANIRKSMVLPSSSTDSGPGTAQAASRILISEQLIPSPPPLYAAFKDYAMLVVGGKERSLKQFEAVAEAAGLVVTGVYRDNGTPHAVIEMQVDGTASLVVGSSSFCLKCGGVVQRHDAQMDL